MIFTPLRMLADDQATTRSLLEISIEDLIKGDVNAGLRSLKIQQKVAETPPRLCRCTLIYLPGRFTSLTERLNRAYGHSDE